MRTMAKWLLSAAVLATTGAAPAMAQPYGYGYDDGPPAFRRGADWDGPPRWDRWHHHRRWRDEGGFERRGWRDDGRDGSPRRFGDDNRRRLGNDDGDGGNRGQFRGNQAGRGDGGGDAVPRRRSPQQGWSGPNTD